MSGEQSYQKYEKDLPYYQEIQNVVLKLKEISKHQENNEFELKVDDLDRTIHSDIYLFVKYSLLERTMQLKSDYSKGCSNDYKRSVRKFVSDLDSNEPSFECTDDVKKQALQLVNCESYAPHQCEKLIRAITNSFIDSELKFRLLEIRRLTDILDQIPISDEISPNDQDQISSELKKLLQIINKEEILRIIKLPTLKLTKRKSEPNNLNIEEVKKRREELLQEQRNIYKQLNEDDEKFRPDKNYKRKSDLNDDDQVAEEHVIVELVDRLTISCPDERLRGGSTVAISSSNKHSSSEVHTELSEKEVMKIIKKLVKKIGNHLYVLKKLEFSGCEVTTTHLQKICKFSSILQIEKLSIEYNTGSVREMIPVFCKIINECKTTNLSLVYNDLKYEDIANLSKHLTKGTKLKELDISYNKKIDIDGFYKLGQLLIEHNIEKLSASNCDISDGKLQHLFSAMKGSKIKQNFTDTDDDQQDTQFEPDQEKRNSEMADFGPCDEDLKYLSEAGLSKNLVELDISWSRNLTSKGFGYLGEFVRNSSIQRLKLGGHQLNSDKLSAFYEELPRTLAIKDSKDGEVLLAELDVSYNAGMKPEAYEVLGDIVKICGVKRLSLAGCRISEKHLQCLRKSTKEYKMTSLSAADNSSIGEGILEIARIVQESELEILDISDCDLTTQEIKNFRKELGETKLKCLSLGDQCNEIGHEFSDELHKLLEHVKVELRLKFRVFRESYKESLQNACKKNEINLILNDQDQNEEED